MNRYAVQFFDAYIEFNAEKINWDENGIVFYGLVGSTFVFFGTLDRLMYVKKIGD